MRTPGTPLRLAITFSSLAIWLTACGDEHGSEDTSSVMCHEAGCDASRDAAQQGDESDATDIEGPEQPDGDAPMIEGDGGAGTVDAGSGSESDGEAPAIDAAVQDTDGGMQNHDSGASGEDAQVGDTGTVTTSPDAGTRDDASTTTLDATVTPDSSTPNPDAGGGSTFVPVRFSATDHGESAVLSPDRLSVENRGEFIGNARSDSAIAPGSGVFYFEAQRLIDTAGFYGIGIGTASASLTGEMGATAASLGLLMHGDYVETGATCDLDPGFGAADDKRYYGFVIDYRASTPRILYVLDDGNGGVEINHRCTTTITTPIYVFYSAARWEVGYQIGINTGADTVNHPFHFSADQVKAALTSVGEGAAAAAFVAGFGKTRALPLSADPVLVFPSDVSVAAGTNVALSGSASDAEDGNLTSGIRWVDISTQHHAQLTGSGASFAFVATLGRHPVIMSVTDSVGRTASHTVMVTATGALPTAAPVRMVVDDLSDPSTTTISGDGLSVDVHASTKKGVRCNQGIYPGQFWYFEARRNGAPANEGVGLMIREGSLNPYDFVDVPWSMSINLTGNTWYNLNSLSDWSNANNQYGFAVDYRAPNPIVYVIIGGVLHDRVVMKDVWTPLYPIVYGNPSYAAPNVDPGNDITVNFGASAFAFPSVATILSGQGINTSGLQLKWGP